MSKEQKDQFDVMKKNIEEEAKKVALSSGGRTVFSDFDSWFSIISKGQKKDTSANKKEIKPKNFSSEVKDKTKIIHDAIISLISKYGYVLNTAAKTTKASPDGKIYSPTGGCSFNVRNRKIVQIDPKKSFIEILTLRDYKNKYFTPKIDGLETENCRKYNSTGANNWGYHMYKIKIEYSQIDKYLPAILQLIDASYHTLKDEKVLNVPENNWETEWNSWLEEVFNSTNSL